MSGNPYHDEKGKFTHGGVGHPTNTSHVSPETARVAKIIHDYNTKYGHPSTPAEKLTRQQTQNRMDASNRNAREMFSPNMRNIMTGGGTGSRGRR